MSDIIPAVFNRIDFWAMLLPGYVLVILGMTLFFPSFLQNNTAAPAAGGTGNISFDIFAAVVFIVAGPAIGFTLSQAVIFFSFIIFFHNKYDFLLAYSHLRTTCKEETRLELDAIDGKIIFNSSTGVALLIIASLIVLQPQLQFGNYSKPLIKSGDWPKGTFITILIFLIGAVLIISGYFEASRVRIPLVCKLLKEHKMDRPSSSCQKYEK
jgi:hypothetical protein